MARNESGNTVKQITTISLSHMAKEYSGYHAYIHEGDDAPSATAVGENMKRRFPGADYELVRGDPWGQCSHVDGTDPKIAAAIADWICSNR
jgi:hypothetical protein